MAAPMFAFQNIFSVDRQFWFLLTSTLCTLFLLDGNCHQTVTGDGFFLCRKCGVEVGKSSDLLVLPTSNALGRRNDTLADKHNIYIQLLQNPHGIKFEVITTSTATVEKANDKYAADSWFPGYVWSLIFCPRCGAHLGWWFDAMTDSLEFKVTSFVGFILEKIIHEDEESNLIAVPKSYMS